MFIGACRAGVIHLFIFMLLILRFQSREGKREAREGARHAAREGQNVIG